MEAVLSLDWRLYPVLALALAGSALVLRGLRVFARARRLDRDPERALLVARAFRTGILGICSLVLAAGWWWQLGWLVALALIVVAEEMLETSVMIAALEDGRRRARVRDTAPARG